MQDFGNSSALAMEWPQSCAKPSIWSLQWRHNEPYGIWNHQPHDCLLNRLFGYRSKKISKLCVTGFCEGNSPVTGEFPAQRASNVENDAIWWRPHVYQIPLLMSDINFIFSVRLKSSNHNFIGVLWWLFDALYGDVAAVQTVALGHDMGTNIRHTLNGKAHYLYP